VRLTQSRYSLCGQVGAASGRWTIPVMLKYSEGENDYTHRVLMTERTQTVKLQVPILRRSAGWIYPNADEKGYYRWVLERGEIRRLARIVRTEFNTRMKLGFLCNVAALFYAGEMGADEFLSIVGSFNADPAPQVVANYDAITKRVPPSALPYYAWIADGRSLKLLGNMRKFFSGERARAAGVKDEVRKVVESVALRRRLNDRLRPGIVKFLDKFSETESGESD